MADRSPLPRLDDMREAIAAIEEDTASLSFEDCSGSR